MQVSYITYTHARTSWCVSVRLVWQLATDSMIPPSPQTQHLPATRHRFPQPGLGTASHPPFVSAGAPVTSPASPGGMETRRCHENPKRHQAYR